MPVVLCDLEGRTHEDAARHLGCPVGTVKSRLARGRGRLGDRLRRRSLILPAGILVTSFLSRTARAVPPASWADAATRTAMQLAAGRSLTAAVSPRVLGVMKPISRGLSMKCLKETMLAILTLGALAAGAGGLAWAGLRQAAGDQEDPSRSPASPLAAVEQAPRNAGTGTEARDAPDIRGGWEVLYMAGNIAGKREGHVLPNRFIHATDKTINLLALTGNPDDPLHDLGAVAYRLHPGLTEQVESARRQCEEARTVWGNVQETLRKRALPEFTVTHARTHLEEAEKALKDAERRRDEAKAAGSREESWVDIEPGPGAGKALQGIYRLQGDILTLCYDAADRGRPEKFAADKPTESLLILRRGHPELALEGVPSHVAGLADIEFEVPEQRQVVNVEDLATFTIRIKNSGTKDATNLLVHAVLSEKLDPVEIKYGTDRTPAQYDPARNLMDFRPIDRLGPVKEIVLGIKVKAKQKGLATCRTFLRHDALDKNEVLEDFASFKITAPGP